MTTATLTLLDFGLISGVEKHVPWDMYSYKSAEI